MYAPPGGLKSNWDIGKIMTKSLAEVAGHDSLKYRRKTKAESLMDAG